MEKSESHSEDAMYCPICEEWIEPELWYGAYIWTHTSDRPHELDDLDAFHAGIN